MPALPADTAARVGIVMPCYNEAARLEVPRLLAALRPRPWLHLLLVDDGSTDGTAQVLQAAMDQAPPGQVSRLALPGNVGKGEAVRQGLVHLWDRGGFAALGFFDADLATPLEAVDDLLAALQQDPRREVALGARVRLLGRRVEREAGRHYGGRVLATLISVALGLPVYDSQCGAKLLRVTPGLPALLARPFASRWLFDVELLSRWMRAHAEGAWEQGLVEVPLQTWVEPGGSKVGLADALRAPLEVARIGWRHRR